MNKKLIWQNDNYKVEGGLLSEFVLEYRDENTIFIITTTSNRLTSTRLQDSKYGEHRYWGTLEEMKLLAEQILLNTNLFNNFVYLDVSSINNNKEVKFNRFS